MTEMKLGEKLKHYRNQRQLTQQQVADVLHVSVKTISAYETGKNEPSLDIIEKLAELYEITPSQLLHAKRTRQMPHIIPIVIHPQSYDALLDELREKVWEKGEVFNFRGTTIEKKEDGYLVRHYDSEFYHTFIDGALNVALAMHEIRTHFYPN